MIDSSRKKVLFIVRFLWGDEGISTGLVRLARGLRELGWDVALASAMGSELEKDQIVTHGPEWFEENGLKHFCVPFPQLKPHCRSMRQAFIALVDLFTLVEEYQPDVINIHSLSMLPFAKAIQLRYHIPFVSTARVLPSPSRPGVKILSFLNRYFDSNLLGARFIAISSEIQDFYIEKIFLKKENVRLVCHGADDEYFSPPSPAEKKLARDELGLDKNEKIICLLGRLDPVKGHRVLIEAVTILRDKGLAIRAICPGKGGDFEDKIRNLPHHYGVSELVEFPGFVDSRTALWASDALVLPSHSEGFGWTIIEAMLCGVVPLRTPSGGASDQIQDQLNGFIFPFDDHESLAEQLETLLFEPAVRRRMAKAALDSAKSKFTLSAMSRKTAEVYQEAIDMNA